MLTVQIFGRVPEKVAGLTRDLRVLWALEELGLPYEVDPLDFEQLDTEAHRARSPFAQLPTIVDNGLVLSESGAILNYLAEKVGDPRRYELIRWSFAALSTLEPAVIVVNFLAFSKSETATRDQLSKTVRRHLAAFDRRLAAQTHVVDNTFSIADILLVTVLRQLDGLGIVDKFEHVTAYKQRCEQRPIWQRVLDAQEDRLGVPRGAGRRTIPERAKL